MSTFNLPNTSIPVTLSQDLSQEQLLSFPAFKTWLSTLQESLEEQRHLSHPFHSSPYRLCRIDIQSCDFFGGGHLGFIKLKAEVSTEDGKKLPGSVFLRGGSVAMLLILQANDSEDPAAEEYVVLVVQPRVPAGSLSFVELPAGMLDDNGTFAGAAAKEIKEETGLEILEKELLDMTELALRDRTEEQSSDEGHLQKALYPSPGGSDEFIPIFLAKKEMKTEEIEGMKGKLTGLREEGEKITLKLCPLKDLWKVGARDGKTLAAVALYEGLTRENKL